jgi:hypothetical protein
VVRPVARAVAAVGVSTTNAWGVSLARSVLCHSFFHAYSQKHRGTVSDSDISVSEQAADLVGAIDDKLTATSHACSVSIKQEVTAAEIALRNVLVRP